MLKPSRFWHLGEPCSPKNFRKLCFLQVERVIPMDIDFHMVKLGLLLLSCMQLARQKTLFSVRSKQEK